MIERPFQWVMEAHPPAALDSIYREHKETVFFFALVTQRTLPTRLKSTFCSLPLLLHSCFTLVLFPFPLLLSLPFLFLFLSSLLSLHFRSLLFPLSAHADDPIQLAQFLNDPFHSQPSATITKEKKKKKRNPFFFTDTLFFIIPLKPNPRDT